jgi:hypothetical protein
LATFDQVKIEILLIQLATASCDKILKAPINDVSGE